MRLSLVLRTLVKILNITVVLSWVDFLRVPSGYLELGYPLVQQNREDSNSEP